MRNFSQWSALPHAHVCAISVSPRMHVHGHNFYVVPSASCVAWKEMQVSDDYDVARVVVCVCICVRYRTHKHAVSMFPKEFV